jgi:hypothetical membrane protein
MMFRFPIVRFALALNWNCEVGNVVCSHLVDTSLTFVRVGIFPFDEQPDGNSAHLLFCSQMLQFTFVDNSILWLGTWVQF